MFELLKFLAAAAILAALGSLSGCSSYPSPDQRLGVALTSPYFGSLDIGYTSGTATGSIVASTAGWTVQPAATLKPNAATPPAPLNVTTAP